MTDEIQSNPIWNYAIENLIKGIGEKSLSLNWLHSKSEKKYSHLNNILTIPSIILSTLAGVGTSAFGADKNINFLMGAISILVSILTTLNSYFMFAKRAELHRITSVSYSKLYLQISIELSLPRNKRMSVKSFMKIVSDLIQRLNEIQPQIPDSVIKNYNKKFKNEPSSIKRPECCNGLVEILVFNESVAPPESVAPVHLISNVLKPWK